MPHVIVMLYPGRSERQNTPDIIGNRGKLYKKPGVAGATRT